MRMRPSSTLIAQLAFCGVVGLSGLLAGCSTSSLKPVSQSVNNLTYNPNAQYTPVNNINNATRPNASPVIAQVVPAPAVNKVEVAAPSIAKNTSAAPTSLAVPVTKPVVPPVLTPEQLVANADQAAMAMPSQNDFFNASMTYDYQQGGVYTIYCAPLNLTDITLGAGEKIISIAAGDTLRWQISQTYSGTGAEIMQHIVVKPNSPNLTNSLLITTDRHVYHLVLKTVDSSSYMVEVNWHYPSDPMMFISNQNQGYSDTGSPNGAAPTGSPFQLDLSRLDFNYEFGTVKGSKPSWYPTRIFNDQRQTFIEFPADFYGADLPVLYIATSDNTYGTMVNWRLKGRYMIIDAVIKNARLASGVESKKDQTIVQIQHT